MQRHKDLLAPLAQRAPRDPLAQRAPRDPIVQRAPRDQRYKNDTKNDTVNLIHVFIKMLT